MNEIMTFLTNKLNSIIEKMTWKFVFFLIIGIILGVWKYGMKATLLTVFIFFSAFITIRFFIELIIYLKRGKKKTSKVEMLELFFSSILFLGSVFVHFYLGLKVVSIFSVVFSIVFGISIFLLSKFT